MLKSIKSLPGYKILATDGEIGKLHDLLFDDMSWATAYFVVETGNWLLGRKVLLAPVSVGQPDWEAQKLPVALTKERIKNSPHIDVDKPVSRQQEIALHNYYGWQPYWFAGGYDPMLHPPAMMPKISEQKRQKQIEEGDPHLRSTREVSGYHIQATDAKIGHVEDFIVSDDSWGIRYLVVDTRNWLPGGKKVLISTEWILTISWGQGLVYIELTKDSIEKSPEYDPSQPVNREYEIRLYDYYGRPAYW